MVMIMEVKLLSATEKAEHILVFSKMTRLQMSASSFEELLKKDAADLIGEIEYALGTIRSSWEFVDYTFLITGVTRAFTHQLVRHRTGVSFAQQAMRVVDSSDFDYLATGKAKGNPVYEKAMADISAAYKTLIQEGVSPQDARGVLPTNVLTNIMMKINLRALSEMLKVRLCFRTQGEYQTVANELRKLVIALHPWTEPILVPYCVETGGCFFRNYKECPIKLSISNMNSSQEGLEEIKEKWLSLIGFEWQPVIKTKED